ncbi:MAG: glutamate--tRNA ligase [Deltaproteobacteria bacterium]|nr:glutamate--tRNA ligase [Deltaproteobacteria bacterium]
MSELVVTRFAPSPTGHLHVGGARTALFNWALARQLGGRFLVRIEDTDQARSSADAVGGILEDLAWLGLDWDDGPDLETANATLGGDERGIGPFYQSERKAGYDAVIASLIERDLAYPAFESPEELDGLRREARAAKQNFRYRRAREFDRETALQRARDGEPHVVRFRMPEEEIAVEDRILGQIAFGEDQLDDFVIRKRDGFPTYHLAVVVDDEAMGVTHVLRGQEHLGNTPRHVALQRALGYREPVYAHLPVIFNPDGSKMSKRDKDKAGRLAVREALTLDEAGTRARLDGELDPAILDGWIADKKAQLSGTDLASIERLLGLELPGIDVEDFRHAGYLPEVLVNFLALLGWSPGQKDAEGKDVERFTPGELAKQFSLERVGKGNAKFDRAKLLAFSQETLGGQDDAEFQADWETWCERYAPEALGHLQGSARARFAAAMKPRSRTLAEPTSADGPGAFALVGDDTYGFDPKAVGKFLDKGEPSGRQLLPELRQVLAGLEPFEPEAIEAAVGAVAEAHCLGMGKVAQPLRVALTGRAASPALGDTLAILGRESVLRRIDRCLAECSTS